MLFYWKQTSICGSWVYLQDVQNNRLKLKIKKLKTLFNSYIFPGKIIINQNRINSHKKEKKLINNGIKDNLPILSV